MPTGEDRRNPRGLMKAARESRDQITNIHGQVDGFLTRLAEEPDLAEPLDDAVRREDRDAVVEVLREGGLEGEITVDRLDPDRAIRITLCAGVDLGCVSVVFVW